MSERFNKLNKTEFTDSSPSLSDLNYFANSPLEQQPGSIRCGFLLKNITSITFGLEPQAPRAGPAELVNDRRRPDAVMASGVLLALGDSG
ncbi:hypothetical protein EVAR_38760_1 [Eumeta japonica]|uniref:Uncharacterized protein n=1 Tax=Eumeta variegata TaxID=151549 RepID=A0A4C1WIT2_EUMVA|nr:hypothetical protein EVAR_38760_1 [Eumeta japonica]